MGKESYQPKIGDRVWARRKGQTTSRPKMVVGPVIDVSNVSCSIRCNAGFPMDKTFVLFLSDWEFEFLFNEDD